MTMRRKIPASIKGRFLAPSVISAVVACANNSMAQTYPVDLYDGVPREINKSCNGFNIREYIYHATCYSPSAQVAELNEHLREGINKWYSIVDKVVCYKENTFLTDRDKALVSEHITAIEKLDTEELDAVANCDTGKEASFMVRVRSEYNAILDIYEHRYKAAVEPENIANSVSAFKSALPSLPSFKIDGIEFGTKWTSWIGQSADVISFAESVTAIRNGAPAPPGLLGSAENDVANVVDRVFGSP